MIRLEAERAQRRPVRVAAHGEHATHRLRHGVRRAPVAVGSALAEGRDRDQHEPRVGVAKRVEAARWPGLDDDVRGCGEAAEQLHTLWPGEIERDAALAGA